MAELFIPTLHTFAMNNIFTGSCGPFRFKAKPNIVKNGREVDMSEDGRLAMKSWLESNI